MEHGLDARNSREFQCKEIRVRGCIFIVQLKKKKKKKTQINRNGAKTSDTVRCPDNNLILLQLLTSVLDRLVFMPIINHSARK